MCVVRGIKKDAEFMSWSSSPWRRRP